MRKLRAKNRMELKVDSRTELVDEDVEILFEKKVTAFGTGAKIDCSKEYLGKSVYVVIRKKAGE
jgi:putative transposon-encoded protein